MIWKKSNGGKKYHICDAEEDSEAVCGYTPANGWDWRHEVVFEGHRLGATCPRCWHEAVKRMGSGG